MARYNRKHGLYKSREYGVWAAMLNRCYNPNVIGYRDYGARGIRVHPRWQAFEDFYADLGPRPRGGTLERADNDGDYEPRNCYWATRADQSRNKRNNRWIAFRGQKKILKDWADDLGIQPSALLHRLDEGWSIEKALTTPKPERPNAKLNMRQARAIRAAYPDLSMDKIAAKYGVSKKTVLNIIHGRTFIE